MTIYGIYDIIVVEIFVLFKNMEGHYELSKLYQLVNEP